MSLSLTAFLTLYYSDNTLHVDRFRDALSLLIVPFLYFEVACIFLALYMCNTCNNSEIVTALDNCSRKSREKLRKSERLSSHKVWKENEKLSYQWVTVAWTR
jgi:hypothetical protein